MEAYLQLFVALTDLTDLMNISTRGATESMEVRNKLDVQMEGMQLAMQPL